MIGSLTVTTDPLNEPVGLDEMKEYLRVDHSDEDAMISGLIVSARTYCEAVTKRAFVKQTLRYTLDEWPDGDVLMFPQPINNTTTFVVKYYTTGSTTASTWGSTNYWIDADMKPGRLVLRDNSEWPTYDLRSARAIEITHESGYGGQGDVPEGVRLAIKFLVGHWYANREAVLTGTVSKPIEFGVHALLAPFVSPFVS